MLLGKLKNWEKLVEMGCFFEGVKGDKRKCSDCKSVQKKLYTEIETNTHAIFFNGTHIIQKTETGGQIFQDILRYHAVSTTWEYLGSNRAKLKSTEKTEVNPTNDRRFFFGRSFLALVAGGWANPLGHTKIK